jgi:hypothetical protein
VSKANIKKERNGTEPGNVVRALVPIITDIKINCKLNFKNETNLMQVLM